MKKLFFILTLSILIGSCKTTKVVTHTQAYNPNYNQQPTDFVLTNNGLKDAHDRLAKATETWTPEQFEYFRKNYFYKSITIIDGTDTTTYDGGN